MESKMNFKKMVIFLLHGLIGWAGCGAIMSVGPGLMSMRSTLIVHAVGAPIIFVIISMVYFRKFNYTTPVTTAFGFLGLIVFLDFFVVALIFQRSFEMFESFIGTWLPFMLIYLSVYITGTLLQSPQVVER